MTTPDEIKADIEQTRAQLADTVDALTDRLDVKARATERAHERLPGRSRMGRDELARALHVR
jgi:hypothetical protein